MAENLQRQTQNKPRLPFSVTLLALGVLIVAGIHLLRLFQTLQNWDFLAELPGAPPIYLALTGLVWAAAGFPLGITLWRGNPPALRSVRFIAVAYIIYDWLNRFFAAFLSGSLATGFAWGFSALLTVILLVWVFWTVSRPRVQAYFRRD